MHKVALVALVKAAAPPPKPNIVFVLADDLGSNELNFMNSTRGILTPNLDALAAQGVTLRNYYVQPICSPTRSALMTGRYTTRLGTQSSVIYWDTPWGIDLNETFLPQNLQDAGYNTAYASPDLRARSPDLRARVGIPPMLLSPSRPLPSLCSMFGKWHLGMFAEAYTPMQRGFEQHMGYYQGCESAWTHVSACCHAGSPTTDQNFTCGGSPGHEIGYDWFKSDAALGVSVPDPSANNTNSVDLIRDAAIGFVRAQTPAKPFFLYLPFQNVHAPYTTQQKYFDMYADARFSTGEKTIFGYLTEMDDAVGAIVGALKVAPGGLYANTVFVFSSDNGAPSDGAGVDHEEQGPNGSQGWIARNHPSRGQKTQIWEGGTKVAGFVAAPGRADILPASVRGTQHPGLFHVTDWLPTLATLGGGTTARNRPLDGFDILPALAAGPGAGASPRTEMLYNINPLCGKGQAKAPTAAIRVGDHKLLSYCYNVSGVGGSTATGPFAAPAGAKNVDPELTKGPVLYDLSADPGERHNIAAANPDIVAKLLARLKVYAAASVEPMQWDPPYQGPGYFCAACPKRSQNGNGVNVPWTPWIK
jgi:arylsulfatase A-like enzyme